MQSIRLALITFAIAFLTWPAFGYIVFLKDGSQVQTREKYQIEGDKAYLTLPSGTVTVLDAFEIDTSKTDEINKVDYGTATLIEGGEAQQLATDTRFEDDKETLADLARRRKDLSAASRNEQPQATEVDTQMEYQMTLAGYIDLEALPKRDYENEDIRIEIVRFLTGQGVEKVTVFQGTQSTHPLLKIVVNSEATVFQALKESAKILIQLVDRFPQQVEAIDLQMTTVDEKSAGQFILTPEKAEPLANGRVSAESFFLRHVEF